MNEHWLVKKTFAPNYLRDPLAMGPNICWKCSKWMSFERRAKMSSNASNWGRAFNLEGEGFSVQWVASPPLTRYHHDLLHSSPWCNQVSRKRRLHTLKSSLQVIDFGFGDKSHLFRSSFGDHISLVFRGIICMCVFSSYFLQSLNVSFLGCCNLRNFT